MNSAMARPNSTEHLTSDAANHIVNLPRPIRRARALIPAVIFAIALVSLSHPPRMSGNVWSRYMTIEAIVERGTLAVNDSPYLGPSGTPDLAKFGTKLYSDKPPVLSILGAAAYKPLSFAGLRMFNMSSPQKFMESFDLVNRMLVAIFIAMPSAMVLYSLRRLLQTLAINRWFADFLTMSFGWSSLLLTYGVTFNNHSVASGLLTIAFAIIMLRPSACRTDLSRTLLSGFCAALAASIDLPAGGVVWAALLIWITFRSRKSALVYLIGSIPPIALHCITQSLVTGSPLPVEMYPEALAYEGSYWASEIGTYRETITRSQFLVELLIGPQGWLTVSPFLVFAPVGFFYLIASRRDTVRSGTIIVAAVSIALLAYYSYGVRRIDYSGQSFGIRHLLPITPLVFYLAVASLEHLRHGLWRGIFVVLMLVGLVYAVAGMKDPWSRIEQRDDPVIRIVQMFVLSPHSSYNR